jgi:signal transduction histidine kinase
MRTLGEELISNERVALIELVKNSYDADASTVVIHFQPPLAEGHGAVEIWDDGHGMSATTVRSAWMEIATPVKKRQERSEIKNRRVLGAKGIGRFAAAQLAYETQVITHRKGEPEVVLTTDWDLFADDDSYLDQVPLQFATRDAEVFAAGGPAENLFGRVSPKAYVHAEGKRHSPHGTAVMLRRLRRAWTENDLRALRNSLSRLIPPPPPTELDVPATPEFSIYLDLPPEFESLSGFVGPSEALAHPVYRLLGSIAADGQANLRFEHGESDTSELLQLNMRDRPETITKTPCGPVKIDVRVWELETSAVKKLLEFDLGARNQREIRELIKSSSGITLYRDGFRVQPFGEPGHDWLRLDQRRINNPTMCLSNNQVSGFVYITADENKGLQDRSHREGLIDSPEYEDLKEVMTRAISEIERRRYALRRQTREQSELDDEHGDKAPGVFEGFTLNSLREAVRNRPDDVELSRAFEVTEEEVSEGVRQVQEILSRFSRLATLGTLVDIILHDGRTALQRISFILRKFAKLAAKASESDSQLASAILDAEKSLSDQRASISQLFKRIEPLSGRQRGRPKNVSLHEVLQQAVSVLEGEASNKDINIEIKGPDHTVTVDPADIIQIVVNLVQNAIYWTSTLPDDQARQIVVETDRHQDGAVTILVSDNGPGVSEDVRSMVFDAYFSTKPDGIGLGLSIAGSITKDFYAGDLELVASGPLPGANFRVKLRRRVG